jgi:hypothetical protein
MIHRHGQHVQSDEQHDYHVEFFICYNLEHYSLRFPLQSTFQNYFMGPLSLTLGLGVAFIGFFEPIFFMAL